MPETRDERVPLGLETMQDPEGHSLVEMFGDAMGAIEDFFAEYFRTRTEGPDKPAVLTLKIEVFGPYAEARSVAFGSTLKLPPVPNTRYLRADVVDGELLVAPPRQLGLELDGDETTVTFSTGGQSVTTTPGQLEELSRRLGGAAVA